ncbi:8763_t:CDS:2 [Entrophospora sp. SA101]|nr:8763_t:CDS:2 [Entrophospora sp. SA101]
MEENEVPVIRAVFFNIISGCCDVKNINEAEYWYNKMINVYQLIPNPKILTTLMYTFIDNRDLYNGINYFKEYFRWKAQLLEYEVMNLLDLCERLGARKALNYIINLLGENGYQEYVHKYEIRRQLIDNKMETINWLNRHVSSASNRNLKLFINKEKYAVKKNIIYKKLDHNAAIRIKNWKPYMYNSLLNVIAKTQNEPATAMEKYNEMKSKGLQPTIVTYNILIGFMKKKKQNHLALELFEQMQKESIVPDAKILESVDITGLKAAKVLQEEYNVIPNIRDYNLMLSTELKRSDYDDALEIHKHMLNNKVKPNLSTYAIIIEDYVRSKETTNAFDIFNAMLKDNLETDIGIYTVLVNAYLEQNNLDMAFNLLDQMKSGVAEFKIGTLESIITTAAENSNEEFVEKIFSYLKSLGVIIDKSIYYILLNRLAKSPWPRYKLEYYIREMEENEVPVIRAVFFNIISGCCDVKNINEAEYWYNKMINVYQLIPNPKILTTLMYTFIDNRDLYNGINYFKEYFRWKAQLLEYEVMNLLDLCERLGARKALNYIINLLGENGYQEYVHKYEIRRQLIDNKMETINWLNRHVSSASNRNLKLFINKEKYAVKKNIIYKKLDHNAAIRIKNWKPYSENNKQ